MKYFYDTTREEIQNWVNSKSFPTYRASQILNWKAKGIDTFENMTNIPKDIKSALSKDYYADGAIVLKRMESVIDGTVKYIIKLKDENIIESVLMRYSYGNSVCISSQAGCKMQCSFCASAKMGFGRNLTSGEMLFQVLIASNDIGSRISNIVVMGIGEPLDNYDNLIKFLKDANDKEILGIGMRQISVSTCGLVDEMIKFTDEGLPITLSVSLHASNDEIRKKLMPVASIYSIDELLTTCRRHIAKTKRRITFEYIMIRDVNDLNVHAIELAEKLKGMICHVNLIPINEYDGCEYKRSMDSKIADFKKILEDQGINTTVRRELGTDLEAACGQLRRTIALGEIN